MRTVTVERDMDVPVPTRMFGYVIVVFGLVIVAAAVVLFAIAHEHSLKLLAVVALEVIAGLVSVGWGGRLIRADAA